MKPKKNKSGFFQKDAWLSKTLGYPAYKTMADAILQANGNERNSIFQEIDVPRAFFYSKVPIGQKPSLSALNECGFRVVDTQLTFGKPTSPSQKHSPSPRVRRTEASDESEVVKIARESFIYSRFHVDPEFSKETANQIKAEWVRNYYRGNRGNDMVVALDKNKPVGFLQLLVSGPDLTIDLIAVNPAQQGKGFAAEMIQFCEALHPECKQMKVGTQANNLPSIRLYEKLGFKLIDSQYILHLHRYAEKK